MPAAELTIRSLTARPVVVPLERPIRTAAGSLPSAALVLVDVETEEGVTGRAYTFGYSPATLIPIARFLENLEELLIGKPVAPVDRMHDFEGYFRLLGRQGLVGMALAGLDMALWDALGRAAEQPVVRLLGGELVPLLAYDSYGAVDPTEDRKQLEQSLDQGFKAIKIKLGVGDLQEDADNLAAVRDIVGPKTALMVDYNQSLSVPEARRRIARLAAYDLHWVEEPVPAEDLRGHALIRANSPVPIQTGENWWFASDMAKAIEAGACDYAMPDIMKIGGITGWLRAMGLGETASLPVSSHAFVEASAHVLAVTPTCHWLEFLNLAALVLREPPQVTDGYVTARGPGLGMDWDEVAVERFTI